MNETVREWLRQTLRPYQSADRVQRDVEAVLSECRGLRPKTDLYTLDDGRQTTLLCLAGTVQIVFAGSSYNIPVVLWIPLAYPSQPPSVFVVPTANMLVKPSMHVDVGGRVYHPYLAYWHTRPDSRLLDLIRILQEVFSSDPPVYAKPPGQTASVTPTTSPAMNGPGLTGSSASSTVSGSSTFAPQIPQRPGTPQTALAAGAGSSSASPSRHQSLPSQSVYGALGTASSSNSSGQQIGFGVSPPHKQFQYVLDGQQGRGAASYGSSPPVLPPKRHMNTGSTMPAPSPPSYASPSTNGGSLPHTFPRHASATNMSSTTYQSALDQPVPTSLTTVPILDDATRELHARRAQLRAKLKQRLAKLEDSTSAEIEGLLASNKQLSQGERHIQDMYRYLVDLEAKLKVNIEILKAKNAELDLNVKKLAALPEVDVDSQLVATSVLGNQLLDLVAEDHALDDTLYQLTRGFGQSSRPHDLTAYLKSVRMLAREQFMKRALIKKVQNQIIKSQAR